MKETISAIFLSISAMFISMATVAIPQILASLSPEGRPKPQVSEWMYAILPDLEWSMVATIVIVGLIVFNLAKTNVPTTSSVVLFSVIAVFSASVWLSLLPLVVITPGIRPATPEPHFTSYIDDVIIPLIAFVLLALIILKKHRTKRPTEPPTSVQLP